MKIQNHPQIMTVAGPGADSAQQAVLAPWLRRGFAHAGIMNINDYTRRIFQIEQAVFRRSADIEDQTCFIGRRPHSHPIHPYRIPKTAEGQNK